MCTFDSKDPEDLGAKKKAEARSRVISAGGFPIFEVPLNAPLLTPEQVHEDNDDV